MARSKWPNRRVKGEAKLLAHIKALSAQVAEWERKAAAETLWERKAGCYLAMKRTQGELVDAKRQLARIRIKMSKPEQPTMFE